MSIAALAVSNGGSRALERDVRRAAADPECRVLTLESLDRLSGPPCSDLLAALDDCPLPLIAGLSGTVGASGLLAAAACDILVAEAGATLSMTGAGEDQSSYAARLQVVLPGGLVRRMILLGETISAEDVARLGALRLTGREGCAAEIGRLGEELSAKSPTALRLLKQSIAVCSALPTGEGMDIEAIYSNIALASPDGSEAARAFLEKRAPVWAPHRREKET